MEKNTDVKTKFVAFTALLITLGFIVAGFVWLHMEPSKNIGVSSNLHRTSLVEAINQLQLQVNQQQSIILELQARIHKLELFDAQIKAMH